MKPEQIIFDTDTIPILDINGRQLDEIKLPEKITPTPRRRCGCSKSRPGLSKDTVRNVPPAWN